MTFDPIISKWRSIRPYLALKKKLESETLKKMKIEFTFDIFRWYFIIYQYWLRQQLAYGPLTRHMAKNVWIVTWWYQSLMYVLDHAQSDEDVT